MNVLRDYGRHEEVLANEANDNPNGSFKFDPNDFQFDFCTHHYHYSEEQSVYHNRDCHIKKWILQHRLNERVYK